MQYFLTIFQIFISIGLIVVILLQRRGAGGSGIFGAGGESSYYTKRGFEKILFISSIVLAGLFIVTAFLNLLI
ncbi:MAG: hypothetical protein AVO34_02290 [Firmicutes bacterium ML8_F2]|jgi:preprotein translocase subunit SecG|nr:MAG: hypothetical protein AVO34_02290 [Firmicutes bacterium ML8_F2]